MDVNNTIYDIANIPYFAYVPGRLAWLTFLGFAFISLALIQVWILSQRATRKLQSAIEFAIKDLSILLNTPKNLDLAISTSRIVRRLLSTLTKEDIAAFSISEIEQYRKKCCDPNLSKILGYLQEIDILKYQGPGEQAQGALAEFEHTLEDIILHIRQYRESQTKIKA